MKHDIKEYTMIALFPALMAATAGIVISFGALPPITLQTLFVYLAGLILGPKKGAIAMLVYVLLGAIGLPVFSGFRGGLGVLLGGSGGFIIGFIISAWLIGFLYNRNFLNNVFGREYLILAIATLLIYSLGALYITILTTTNYWLVLGGFYIYLIGDMLKIVTAIYVHVRIRSHVTYEYS